MYQYKAILKSTKEIVAEGHTIEDIEKQIIHYKRQQKKGFHTHGNEPVQIFHVQRNQETGKHKDLLLKVV
jgi:hypothetical protein